MKIKIFIALTLLILMSCKEEAKYKYLGQEIIDGKVSAVEKGIIGKAYQPAILPKIWVQNATQTKEINIPFEYEGKWKVGDSCLLIIEKYEEIKQK